MFLFIIYCLYMLVNHYCILYIAHKGTSLVSVRVNSSHLFRGGRASAVIVAGVGVVFL